MRSYIPVLFARYIYNDHVKKGEVGRAYSTHGDEE
jgi:hypothetical protein